MSAEPETEPKPRKRRALKVVLTLLIIIVALVASLPFIASMDAVKNEVVKKVNEAAAPMSLDLASMSFSWTKGIELNGVTFSDPAMAMIVRCDEVVVDRPLLSLAQAGLAISSDP